jgi:predicted nucleotidyltransferase
MLQANGLKKEEQDKIIGLCKAILPDCAIWLYGSRARGDLKQYGSTCMRSKTVCFGY